MIYRVCTLTVSLFLTSMQVKIITQPYKKHKGLF